MQARNCCTMKSVPPLASPSNDSKIHLPAEVLAELRTIFPDAPKDEYVSIGRCPSTQKDITICYNTFGDRRNPCMLLIMGLNSTGPYWDTRFCVYLAEAGFFVVRYDNRDVGLSTHFDEYPAPNILRMALPSWASLGEAPLAYTLADMAGDAMGLLRALKISTAHLVGFSMGGMIAQCILLNHPEVVASLCLLSTSTGVARPKPQFLLNLLDQPESSRDVRSILDYRVRLYQAMSGDLPFPEHEFRLAMWWDAARSNYSGGAGRHLAAIARSTNRTALLRERVNAGEGKPHAAGTSVAAAAAAASSPSSSRFVPVVVLHGGRDPVIPLKNARRLSKCIRGAKLVIFPRMGHYFPKEMFRHLADEIITNARSAIPAE